MLTLLIPSISTKVATFPCELLIVHAGPGEIQPGGVPPGLSQRLAVPTGDVIPGLKMLLFNDVTPVLLLVTSVMRTIHGEEQGTREFQEPVPVENCGRDVHACKFVKRSRGAAIDTDMVRDTNTSPTSPESPGEPIHWWPP